MNEVANRLYKISQEAATTSKVNNKLMKFWATLAKNLDVKMDITGDYWVMLDDIIAGTSYDEGNLIDSFFQPALASVENDNYVTYTLGELAELDNNEGVYGLRQFAVSSSRVGTLAYNLIIDKELYSPIEVGYVDGQLDLNISGRHRLCALIAIFSKVADWEDLQITVKRICFSTKQRLAKYIELANGSRTMTAEEKLNLWYGTQGYDTASVEDIFAPCKTALGSFNKACSMYFQTQLEASTVVDVSPSTCGRIGASFAMEFRRLLEKNTRKFLRDSSVAYDIADTAVCAIEDNWDELRSLCRRVQRDNEGNEKALVNVARYYKDISAAVAKVVASNFEEELAEKAAEDKVQREAKVQATKKRALEQVEKEKNKTFQLLKDLGIEINDAVAEKVEAVASK